MRQTSIWSRVIGLYHWTAKDRMAADWPRLQRENDALTEELSALRAELMRAHQAEFDAWSRAKLSEKKLNEDDRQLDEKLTHEWAARSHAISQERDALKLRVSDLAAKGRRVVADRDGWEAEANRLTTELAAATLSDAKFTATKRAFAQHFHPNNGGADGLEKTVRTVIFTEFWPVIESIATGQATK